ncbi:peptidase M23 [Rhodovulum sp. DZ06]|uniref:peptidase M23 n=1 Tax=Rhodovulum sp. DZ06 TaxID=3425126 RepID=UPI003D324AB8
MKTLAATAAAILSAAPALAHDGAHMHPHGAEAGPGAILASLALLAMVMGAVAYWRR